MNRLLPLDLSELQKMLQELKEQRRAAKEDHAQTLAYASELQRKIHALDQSIAPLARLLGEEVEPDSPAESTAQLHADAAEGVMKRRNRPLRVAELVEELKAIGHPLPLEESQQYIALHSALKRRPKTFRRAARGLWVLIGSEADKSCSKDMNKNLLEGQGDN